jgi:8-amino-7-oxononanoate synthase
VDASSNDYLGYAALEVGWGSSQLVSRETLGSSQATPDISSHQPAGAGASRLLGGTRKIHRNLEQLLADWVHQESSLLFSSGYAANLGLLASLPREGDVILSDQLNHASIVDGCRLSRARVVVYPHLDLLTLRNLLLETPCTGTRYIISESYFSMDADSPKLADLAAVANDTQSALILDEAHALGVFGEQGAGLAAAHGVTADIVVGTLGKSVGIQGAFVAAPTTVRAWLWNRARSFVYSTGLSPALAQQIMLHVKHVQGDASARALLTQRVQRVRETVARLGLSCPPASHGPIVPILLGTNEAAIQSANRLRARGVLAFPIRPPTVPDGTARLRLTISAATSNEGFEHLLNALPQCLIQ